jgi:putative FmdB family regulatory protein
MPMYLYRCAECGAARDQFDRVSDRDANIPECHGAMERQICMPLVSVQTDICAKSPIDGTVLTSRRQRTEYMKRNDLQEARPSSEVIREATKRRRDNEALAAQLPGTPDRIKQQLFKEAGFPG